MTSQGTPSPRVWPTHERALRAFKALDEGRIADALTNAEAIADGSLADSAWKCYLIGRVQLEQGELESARKSLERSAALALQLAKETPDSAGDAMRLAGESFEQLGRAHRRGEQIEQARRAHEAAYGLRCEHGSAIEQWESAESSALDYLLAVNHSRAEEWCDRALTHAELAGGACSAKSRGLLAVVLLKQQRFADAVKEARTAVQCWRQVASGDRRAFLAQKQLGVCLLRQAESLFEGESTGAVEILSEGIELLDSTHRELSAFGDDSVDDARECGDLLDFSRRLRASLL